MSRWAAVGLAAVAGGAWALAAPPRGWWLLLPLGAGAFAVALAGRQLRQRLVLGTVAGGVLYTTTLSWLADFSLPGYLVMAALEATLLAAAAALTARWWTLPATLMLLEALQARFPLGARPGPPHRAPAVRSGGRGGRRRPSARSR